MFFKQQLRFANNISFLKVNQIQQNRSKFRMNLQYDESLPPPQHLKVDIFDPKYHLQHVTVKKLPSEGFAIKYSPDDKYIAIGCRSGSRLLFSTEQNKITNRYQCLSDTAVTCIRWRPSSSEKYNILATSDADGNVNFWHVPSMKKVFNLREDDNTILALDYSPTGEMFATGGKDCHVRIYDQQTKSIAVTCKSAQWNTMGHDNRVFCLKFIDENLLLSGGWDSVVHIWDVRQAKSIKHFLGPHISGDSLDYQDGKILAGCYSANNQIQIWDFSTCKKIQEIDWTGNIDQAEYIYTSGYSKHNPGLFGAGSTGKNSQVRLYRQDENGKHKKVCGISGLSQGCYSLDFANKRGQFAFTTAHHGVYIYNYNKK